MITAVAWIAILVTSNLPNIAWRLATHSDAPFWTVPVRLAVLGAGLGLSVAFPELRSLRGYLIALIAALAGLWLKDAVYQIDAVAAWIRAEPWRDAVIVSSVTKLIPVAVMSLTVIGLSRRELFLVKGDLAAPGRLPFLDRTLPWTSIGIALIIIFGAVTALFLVLNLRPEVKLLPKVIALLPVILTFSVINAFSEEYVFRSVLLARLVPTVGAEQALWMTSVRFGLGHWFGNPPGPIGVFGSTILGLMLGKSMLETSGMFWAWGVHAVLDVVLFTLLIVSAR